MTLISSSRMYNVNPQVERNWAELFACISASAQVELTPLQHAPPTPIDDLWSREDMGLVLMCGWPFDRAKPQPTPLASYVPSDPHAQGRPVYWSDLVTRVDAEFQTLEDTFGHRMAWTVTGSQSGYNAPRRLLLDHVVQRGQPLFSETVGPVISPMGAIESVLSNTADVAPVDGFFHLLLKKYAPEIAAQIRILARTPVAPMPLLVASPNVAPDIIRRLQTALCTAHDDPESARLMNALCIETFVEVDPADYGEGERWAAKAEAADYVVIV